MTVACLLLLLFSGGCNPLRVHLMQRRAAQGDDLWIASQAIDCHAASPSCARLHLIKGIACLRLAESEMQAAAHYACAATELADGLALMPAWEDRYEQIDAHRQYCTALDGLQRLQSGATADEIRDRLLDAAKALYRLAPDSVPATYYISVARLRRLAPRLAAVTPADRLPVCSRLKRTVNQVLSLMETARHEHLPAWDRFADRYQRLAFDLGKAMQTAGCR